MTTMRPRSASMAPNDRAARSGVSSPRAASEACMLRKPTSVSSDGRPEAPGL